MAGLASVTFTATATAPGTIALNTNALSYAVTVGSPTAGTQTVNISNGGSGSLTGIAIGTITYGPGASGWLTAVVNASSAPSVLTVTTNTAGITAPGTYTATIPVTASGSTNSPQNIAVTLNVFPLAPPNTIVITQQPSGTVTGVVLATQPILKITDNTGATVTSMNGPVVASLASGTGTLAGTTTVNAVNGIATFTNLKIFGAGQFTLGFSAAGAGPATSAAFSLTALPATQIAIGTQPAGASSNTAFTTQPVVQLLDVNGNPAIGATGPVTVAIGAGGTGTGALSGTTTVNAINGIATFTNLKLSAAGTYALTFSSGALPPATSSIFTVAVSPPVSVNITAQPTGAQTGSPLGTQPVVELRDQSGTAVIGATNNVTAILNGGGGVLSGTTTVAAVNGVATFSNLVVTGSGTYTLTFNSAGVGATVSNAFVITPLPPTQLGVATQPVGGGTGSTLVTAPVVQVRDALGSTVVGATNAVTATLVGAGGVLSGTQTVNAVNGVATFNNLIVTGPGTYTLSFAAAGLTSATSAPFTITALPPTQLGIATQPSGATTGSALTTQPVIQVKDANGSVVAGATNSVTATIGFGSAGTLSGTTTVAAVNGVATFTNLVISGAGNSTIVFSSAGLSPVTSANIPVSALPPTQLAVSTQPGNANTGALLAPQPVVQVRDVNNGVVAGAANAVTATLVGAGGVLSGTQTVNAVNGVATFTNLVVTGPGTYTLSFTANGLTTANSAPFTIAALPPTQLGIGTQPSGATTGTALTTQPVIQVKDANGGVVTGATNSVTATIGAGSAGTLSGTTTVAAVNGVATFTNLVITGAGNSTIVFTSAGLTPVTSANIPVGALPPTQLGISSQPASGATTRALSPAFVVQVKDVNGGVVTGAANSVTATIGGGSAGTLSGTVTVAAVNGVATFSNLIITGTGNSTIVFSAAGLTAATSGTITVSALPPTQLGILTQPAGAVTSQPFTTQPVIQVKDVNGGVVAGATNVVTATIGTGTGTLIGTVTATAVNGVATFTNLGINGAGNSTIVFSATGLTSATSTTITVAALPPVKLAISVQPAAVNVVAGAVLSTQPVIQVQDAGNGVVAGATNAVTATLSAGGALLGTQTVSAVNGTATFTNLAVSVAGTYTLTFSAAGLTSTPASTSFTVLAPFIGLNVGSTAATAGAQLTNLAIPVIVDMSKYAGCTPIPTSTTCSIASLSFVFTWDATKMDYVSVANGSFGTSPAITTNPANAATGSISVSMFDASGNGFTSGSPTVITVTLKPKASTSTSTVTTTTVVAGDDAGSDISSRVSVRATTVSVP